MHNGQWKVTLQQSRPDRFYLSRNMQAIEPPDNSFRVRAHGNDKYLPPPYPAANQPNRAPRHQNAATPLKKLSADMAGSWYGRRVAGGLDTQPPTPPCSMYLHFHVRLVGGRHWWQRERQRGSFLGKEIGITRKLKTGSNSAKRANGGQRGARQKKKKRQKTRATPARQLAYSKNGLKPKTQNRDPTHAHPTVRHRRALEGPRHSSGCHHECTGDLALRLWGGSFSRFPAVMHAGEGRRGRGPSTYILANDCPHPPAFPSLFLLSYPFNNKPFYPPNKETKTN